MPEAMGELVTLQRHSTKIDVQLEPLATFEAFEKHVGAKFELADGAAFVVSDFDRETVVDNALYASMRSGNYWRKNLKANRLFLVLDNLSAPLIGDVELEVSYQPHFNTITKTGDANFSKIPHAVAELIDNSIQATNSNSGKRTVELEVELGGRGASFLVVKDNGRGMNASGLKDFATYFLTQENRGVSGPQGAAPSFTGSQSNGSQGGGGSGSGGAGVSASKRRASASFGKGKGKICSGFISKFGVGALQAGFYIGSCLTVVTKTATQPDVYEFVMNEAEFERRAETNSAMFRDNIKLRNAGKGKREGPESERNGPAQELLDRLREEEAGNSHFTYIVLALRDQHVEWFANNEKGCLKRELASIYHYYLHPEHCPDGIRRDDGDSSGQDDDASADGDAGGRPAGASNSLDILYTQRTRLGQVADKTRLADINDDLESRLNAGRKASFLFHMEILHPMQDPKLESKRLPVTGVIHYYPYDGEKETRPQTRPEEEDDESTTIEAFWEGRLVPDSHAAALSFFPLQKLKKKEREALGTTWKRRIKGMLFFDWHFPISNNKLRLQFIEGDLHTALNAKNTPPKHPAVMYPGSRGRQIEKEFRDWLIKCHETLDIEYRFDDKLPSAPGAKHEKWRKMTFGKGGTTFVTDSRVKLPFLKPNGYGIVNYFMTEVDDEEEDGRGQGQFSLQRWPMEVFGLDDSCAKLYPVTELDPEKSRINSDDWDRAMVAQKKQLPVRVEVRMTANQRPLPKRLAIRTGKEIMTGVQVQIFDGYNKPVVQFPQGKSLRAHSYLEQPDDRGRLKTILAFTAKAFSDKKFDKMYFFDPMTIKIPGEYKWTVAVTKEGKAADSREDHLLSIVCSITVMPGNPTKLMLEGEEQWDSKMPLGNPCWLPPFSVKLRDSSKCVCPMLAYASVTIACVEPGAFDVIHASSKSATHRMGELMDAPGPLQYDGHSWKLVPKQTGMLSSEAYVSRAVEFEVTVVAKLQNEEEETKIFKDTLEITFEPGPPSELVLLDPAPSSDGTPVVTVEAGEKFPGFSLGAVDAGGNKAAPFQNETWQVTLEITAAVEGADDEEGPDFVTAATEKVAAGAAIFKNPVVKWNKQLRQDGELAVVDATLSIGSGNRDKKEVASASFLIRIKPSKNPIRAVICLDGNPWPTPGETEKAVASAEKAVGTGAAKAADAVGVSRAYQAGSVISGLHLRLYDQGGVEVVVGMATFDASNDEAVTCSWAPAWRWKELLAGGRGGLDRLPDLKVPTQLSRLTNGIHHAKVVLQAKLLNGRSFITLGATFAVAVHAGPVARWMAVRADTGKISEKAGPLTMTAGQEAKLCQASFAKAVKGFLPVDEYGNLVKNVQRAPEVSIEGMPDITLLPEHQCKLAKPTKPGGLYQFPRALNLIGSPCEGQLLISSPRTVPTDKHGAAAAAAGAVAAASPGGGGGGGSSADGVAGDLNYTRVLRLAVQVMAGGPAKVLIRAPSLGEENFSSSIRATLLAGFKVSDLEVNVVDSAGNPASLPPRGVKVTVTSRNTPSASGSPSSASPKKSSAAKELSKRSTHDPSIVLPRFALSIGLQEAPRVQTSPSGGSGASARAAAAAAAAAAARAAAIAKDGVVLVVRAEGSQVEGVVEEACIHWIRLRTSAVTKVHLATLDPDARSNRPQLQEAQPLTAILGQRARRVGVVRPVDGPLPTLVVWLDTDNDSAFTPTPESISFSVTTAASTGPRTLTNLYEAPVSAPASMRRPHALVFKPKSDPMEQNVGDHTITCSYVERRGMPPQGTQGEAEEKAVDMVLRVVAGAPFKLVPFKEDANLFHSLSASNQSSMDPDDDVARNARRLVEKTFRFTVNDLKGNIAGKINGPVRMRIENLEGVNVPDAEMPRLEASDEDGYVQADPTATGVFLFEENWLQAEVGTREGDYRLTVDSEGDPELRSWSTLFHFDTDQRRLNSIREVKGRLKPLEDRMDRFHAALHAAQQKEESARRQVESSLSELPQSITSNINLDSEDYAACVQEAQRLLQTFQDELGDQQRHRARAIKFDRAQRMRAEDEQRINPMGYIVELGYVEDEYIAKLLSQKGGSKMKAVYVDTKQQLDMVRRAGAGGFCKETVANFRVPSQNGLSRPRNAAEIAQKSLPLRHLKEPGFIDYLVNMIQLPDQREELRDTLFSALYGSMVMFDTHDNAHRYQKNCKRIGKMSLPILVKEDGASLERNGYMPPAKDPDSLNKLKMVYASMPATLTPEYSKTEQYIRQLNSLIPALQDLLDAEGDVSGVHQEHDVDEWRADIAILQSELEALVSRGGMGRGGSRRSSVGRTGARAGGGGGGGGGAGAAGNRSSSRGSTSNGKRSSTGGGGAGAGGGAKGKGKGKGRKKEAETSPRARSAKRARR